MKKIFALALCLIMFFAFCGCKAKGEPSDLTVNLDETPVGSCNTASGLPVKETVRIDFALSENGYLKLLAYDCTEYEIWPNEEIQFSVSFVDEKGDALYSDIPVYGGYTEKYLFEAGTVTAVLTCNGYNENMNDIYAEWAFAPDNDDVAAVEVDSGIPAAARINADGEAKFSFTADENAIYYFTCGEACIFESDCDLYIETADGEKVTGNMNIHGTEWATRWAFLPVGEYVVTVYGIDSVASCKIGTEEVYENVVMQPRDGLQVPVDFGFNALNTAEKTATFTHDSSQKYLTVEAYGTNSFYEYEQGYTLTITDADGNIVLYNEDFVVEDYYYEGGSRFDLSGYTGEYTVTVSSSDACVVSIGIEVVSAEEE